MATSKALCHRAIPNLADKSFEMCHNLYSDYHRAETKSILCKHALGQTQAAISAFDLQTVPKRDSLQLHYETAVLYWDHVKFASAMLNVSNQLNKTMTNMDTSAIIAGILESLGVIDPVDAIWDGLQETLLGAQTLFGLS